MEQRIKCPLPAPTDASDRLIDLVDAIPVKQNPVENWFSFLMRDRPLVRPSLEKIDRLVHNGDLTKRPSRSAKDPPVRAR